MDSDDEKKYKRQLPLMPSNQPSMSMQDANTYDREIGESPDQVGKRFADRTGPTIRPPSVAQESAKPSLESPPQVPSYVLDRYHLQALDVALLNVEAAQASLADPKAPTQKGRDVQEKLAKIKHDLQELRDLLQRPPP